MAPSAGYVNTCVNPWVETPSGVADEFSMPTTCLKFRSISNSTTSSGGHAITLFSPWAIASTAGVGTQWQQYCTFTAATTTIASYVDGTHPDVATINSNFDRLRTVSCGVKAYYTGSEQNTAGVITIVPIVSVIPSLTTLPTDAGVWANMPGARTVSAASMTEPLCGAFHNFDRPRFHLGTDTSGSAWFPSFAVIGIGLQASSAVLRIEIEVNLEVIPRMITAINANSYSVVDHSDAAMAVTRRLDSTRVGSYAQVTSLKGAGAGKRSGKRRSPAGKGLSRSTYKRKRLGYAAKSIRRRRKPMRRMRR